MNNLPEEVRQAWEDREGPVVLTTISRDGIPNSIYATCVSLYEGKQIVVADNYFSKTRGNILSGSSGTVLFITKERKSYQIKGKITYHKEGDIFLDMKKWNPEKHPGHAAAAVSAEEVYKGSEKLL